MKKYIVISDSHGNSSFARMVINLHADCDGVIFLGDGNREMSDIEREKPDIPFFRVRGNCDSERLPDTLTIEADGVRILCMHGHTYSVKSGDEKLLSLYGTGYDVILHGHTHIPREKCVCDDVRPLYIMNPGALCTGRFGLLTIKDGEVLTSLGSLI